MIDPNEDGKTHINVYSKGKTKLGRMLSNFHELPVETIDGEFSSIEGYWYWLGAARVDEREALRELSGYDAKEIGRLLQDEDEKIDEDLFRSKIKRAIWGKIVQDPIIDSFISSDLPFEHYYVYGGQPQQGPGQWIMDFLERFRSYLQNIDGNEVIQRQGDLFEAPQDYALAHCVSSDGEMGAGIAEKFVDRFPNIRESVEDYGVGEAALHEENGRMIFNLITKKRYFHKPMYEAIEDTLYDLRSKLIQRGKAKLAMPRIASGLDGKKWEKVLPIIEDVFKNSGIIVEIRYI